MEQTKGLMKRIEILAPRGYRYFPKMGRMAAHWIDPGHLPISEAQVQRVMRRALAKPAAAPSRNATLGGDKVALPGQGGGGTGKNVDPVVRREIEAKRGEAAAIGELRRTAGGTVLAPIRPRSWKLPNDDHRNRKPATTIERVMRNINIAVEKATGGVGRIFRQAGRGVGEAFEGKIGIGPETWRALVKFGIFRSNNTDIMSGVQAFNEVLIGGGAVAGELALRTLMAVENFGVEAIVQFAREAGETETGARKLQRDLGVLAMIAGMVSGRNARAFGRGANPRASRSAREVRTSKASPRNVVLSKRAKQILRLNKEHSVPFRRPPTGGRVVPDNLKWLNSDTGVATGGLKGHAKNHPLAGNTDVENYRRQVVATIRFGNKIEKRHNGQIKDYYIRFFRMDGKTAKPIFIVTSMPKHGSMKGFTTREYTVKNMRDEFGWPPKPE